MYSIPDKMFLIIVIALFLTLLTATISVVNYSGYPHRLPPEKLKLLEDKDQLLFGGQNCENDYKYCGTGARKQKSIFLVGDSFARQWGYGLSDNFDYKINHIGLLCVGIDVSTCAFSKPFNGLQQDYKKKLYAYSMIKISHAPLVITLSWRKYLEGYYEVINNELHRNKLRKLVTVNDYLMFHKRQILELSGYFKGNKIIIIGYLPGTNYKNGLTPYSCYSKPLLFGYDKCVEYPIKKVANLDDKFNGEASYAKYINQSLREYSESFTNNILFLNPFNTLCPNDSCLNIMDGNNIYLGGNHINKYFSIYFLKEYSEEINKHILRGT